MSGTPAAYGPRICPCCQQQFTGILHDNGHHNLRCDYCRNYCVGRRECRNPARDK